MTEDRITVKQIIREQDGKFLYIKIVESSKPIWIDQQAVIMLARSKSKVRANSCSFDSLERDFEHFRKFEQTRSNGRSKKTLFFFLKDPRNFHGNRFLCLILNPLKQISPKLTHDGEICSLFFFAVAGNSCRFFPP